MNLRLSHMCTAALILSTVRGGVPPFPPLPVTTGPLLRCPWGISEGLDVDGEPWWQSAIGDASSPSWYEHFITRRQGGAMLGPIYVPVASPLDAEARAHHAQGKHFSRLCDDCDKL